MRRVLLKLSGEAISDPEGEGILGLDRLRGFCQQVADALAASDEQIQLALVVGGGNIVRGKSLSGFSRARADHMGMLATVINALAFQDALGSVGVESRVMSGIEMPKVAEPYIYGRALRHLEKGRVVIFAGGTGNPLFTTDTAAAMRAAEIDASVLLLAKYLTDGVYDKDPRKFGDAKKYDEVSYGDLVNRNLEVMDQTAVTLCKGQNMPIFVFDMEREGALKDAILGREGFGTWVK